MPLKTEAMAVVDTLEPEAAAIGSINTIILRPDPTTGQPTLVGQNYDWEGVRESIRNRLPVEQQRLDAPFGAGRSGVVIGGGGTTRAAVYALSRMALSPIYLVNRDPDETQAIVASFPQFDLRAVESVEEWDAACEDAIACVVGAIPSFEPVTEGEKKVYAVAAKLFGGRVNDGRVRYFLEMCYKVRRHFSLSRLVPFRTLSNADSWFPFFFLRASSFQPRVTILYKMAEAQGWIVVPGMPPLLRRLLPSPLTAFSKNPNPSR